MIKVILTDIGQVLTRSRSRGFANGLFAKYDVDVNKSLDLLNECTTHEYECGKESTDVFLNRLVNKLKLNISLEELKRMLLIGNEIDSRVLDFYKMLKTEYGLKIVILSNSNELITADFKNNNNMDFFDLAIFSEEVGLIKPHKEIYECTLSKLGVKGEECIFIDDKKENIDAAVSLGIKGVIYSGDFDEMKKVVYSLL